MESIAHKCYDEFNAWRKQIESKEADEQDMKMLEDVENRIKAKWFAKTDNNCLHIYTQ